LATVGGEIDSEWGAEVAVMLKKAIAMGLDRSPYERARALRTLDELSEAKGDLSEALDCYKRAIALDSKVGLRRKIEAVRKLPEK
jgi:tetratricopeptide (TPR) repeat protein